MDLLDCGNENAEPQNILKVIIIDDEARSRKALGDTRFNFVGPLIEDLADPVTELPFLCLVHDFDSGVMPRAVSAAANACAAREQCVLTLPSEQFIALAVSATSSSSQ